MRTVAILLAAFLFAATVDAQSARTFVSAAAGSDTNNCSRLAPCRTFGAALTNTASGGEVIVLDSGGYGPVTVSQTVSIISPPGVYAGITATSAPAIAVDLSASSTAVTVALRGLTLNGVGASVGILFRSSPTAASALYVDSCLIAGFGTDAGSARGIQAAGARLVVTDTMIRGIRNGTAIDVSGGSFAAIDRVRIENCTNGGVSAADSHVVARNTFAVATGTAFYATASAAGQTAELDADHCVAGNGGWGFEARGGAGHAQMNLTGCVATQNANAGIILDDANATAGISKNIVTDNGVGTSNTQGGILYSAENNTVRQNATADMQGAPIQIYSTR